MPAFRSRNLRSGDLAEQFGLYLLQCLTLVAPVPRTEDVGIDAICTLVEDFDRNKIIAKESFCVQIKSKTVTSLDFLGEEIRWLSKLEIPLFILSVDRDAGSADLYSMHAFSFAYATNKNRNKISFEFLDDTIRLENFSPQLENVSLGRPILTWTLKEAHGNNFRKIFTRVMRSHITRMRDTIKTREHGWIENIAWETNQEVTNKGWQSCCSSSSPEIIDDITDVMMPFLSMLIDNCLKFKSTEWLKEIMKLCGKAIIIIKAKRVFQK